MGTGQRRRTVKRQAFLLVTQAEATATAEDVVTDYKFVDLI